MAGPGQRALSQVRIHNGQAQVQYAATNLAYLIQNLEMTSEGTLRAIRGACPYEPDRGGNQYGGTGLLEEGYELFTRGVTPPTVYGIFHVGLLEGKAPTLLARAGTKLYMHAGWRRSWKVIYEGLTDDGRAGYPDVFVSVNDTIIWTNGIDPALVISYDGMVVPLGFDRAPGAPAADGPQQPPQTETLYANSQGYSWGGRIGTIGDFVDTNDGAVLNGRWRHATAWEDVHGNVSPMSPAGTELVIALQRANATVTAGAADANKVVDESTQVDDLPRQFVVKSSGDAPAHAVAWRLYRTPDSNRFPAEFRLLERISGTANFVYADNVPDSRLGAPAKEMQPVPRFGVMTSHAGALVIADGPRVMRSEVGYPGSLIKKYTTTPDPDGARVTALASHGGRLIAFTERSMVDITDPTVPPTVMVRGVGCVAPRSVLGMPDGLLVWLSRDAFYGWHPDKGVMKLSDAIHRLVTTELASGSLRNAVAVIEPESREYRCAVTRAGEFGNSLLLCFDSQGWREVDLGYKIEDMCVTDDARYLVLFAGTEEVTRDVAQLAEDSESVPTNPAATSVTSDVSNVFVMGHEVGSYKQPKRVYRYLSAWLRGDDTALKPINVHTLYIGMVDEINESIDINIRANGASEVDPDSPRTVRAVGVQVRDLLGDLKLGTGKTHARRLYWRRVTVALENVNTWSFEMTSDKPYHLAAFAFQVSFATKGDELGRIPLGEDE